MTRKDLTATVLTGLTVAVFFATREGWNVWLIGDSHRWAAGAILVLGMLACSQASPGERRMNRTLAMLGILALVLAILSLATGSLAALSLLVVDTVLLWAGSTLRHARWPVHRPPAPA